MTRLRPRSARRLLAAAACALALPLAPAASAQDAPFYAPDDNAWLTVGWAGAEALAPAYDASVLGQLLGPDAKNIDLAKVVQWVDVAFDDFDLQDPVVAPNLTLLQGVRDWPLRAEFIAPAPPRITLSPDAAAAPAILDAAQSLAQQAGGDTVDIVQANGEITVAASGMPTSAARNGAPAQFMDGLAANVQTPAVSLYANTAQITQFALSQAPMGEKEGRLLAELGALSLQSAGLVAGFDVDGMWRTEAALQLDPAQPAGLWDVTEGPGITADDFAIVPAQATSVAAAQLDLPQVLQIVRQTILTIEPGAEDELDMINQAPSAVLGSNLQDFAGKFGPTWVAYVDPRALGPSPVGAVLLNRANDPQGVADALEAANATLAAAIKGFLSSQRDAPPLTVRFFAVQRDGITAYTLPGGFVQPTYAVINDYVVIGLQPQAVLHAAKHLRDGGDAITATPAFQAAWAKQTQAPGEVRAFGYNDRPTTLASGYASGAVLSGLVAGPYAIVTGDDLPVLLPTWEQAQQLLQPSWWALRRDANQLRFTAVANTPADALLGINAGPLASVAPLATMTGFMVPALGAARQTARQTAD
ncbi:MAG: hypothetical protein AAGA57_11345, partial [Planctomycetota bacterium]